MPASVVLIPVLAAAVLGWAWRLRHGHGAPWPGMLAAYAMPFAVPHAWPYPRLVFSVLAITLSMKCWALVHGGPADPRATTRLRSLALWLLLPPEVRWPTDASTADIAVARGRARLRRAAAKAPAIAALLWLHLHWPGLHDDALHEGIWALWMTWLCGSSIADLGSGVVMQWGLTVDESFDSPPLARSPREFWAKRWNLIVAGFFARHVFAQVGGRRRPLRATVIVFVGSGLMHELFVAACVGGVPQRVGWMTAFFALHGAGVLVQMRLDRRRRRRPPRLPAAVAIALHVAWLSVTAPLFFGPLGELFTTR